jgi:hypothetical protein
MCTTSERERGVVPSIHGQTDIEDPCATPASVVEAGRRNTRCIGRVGFANDTMPDMLDVSRSFSEMAVMMLRVSDSILM